MSPAATRVATFYIRQASSFQARVEALASTATRYPEDAASDVNHALHEAVAAEPLIGQLVRAMAKGKGRVAFGGVATSSNGREPDEDSRTSYWWEVEYPTSVVLRHGIRAGVARVSKAFASSREVQEHQLDPDAMRAFFEDPIVKNHVAGLWAASVRDAAQDISEFALVDRAEEAAYQKSEVDMTATEYDDGSEEELHMGPELRFKLNLHFQGVKVTEAALIGSDLVAGLEVTYRVSMGKQTLPWEWGYDRMN